VLSLLGTEFCKSNLALNPSSCLLISENPSASSYLALLQVAECSSLEDIFHNSSSRHSFESFHTILYHGKMWAIWPRRSYNV
jgi:hypothetical protein